MAKNASHRIMRGAREEFQAELERKLPRKKLIRRIVEGLDAKETKLAQYEGKYTDSRNLIAGEVRRRYAELAARLLDYLRERIELTGSEEAPLTVDLHVNFFDDPAAWAASRQANQTMLGVMGTSARQPFTVPGKRKVMGFMQRQ
jgi:hypothetical protein